MAMFRIYVHCVLAALNLLRTRVVVGYATIDLFSMNEPYTSFVEKELRLMFLISNFTTTWSDAADKCEEINADILELRIEDKRNYMNKILASRINTDTSYHVKGPSNQTGWSKCWNKNCCVELSDKTLNVLGNCAEYLRFICQRKILPFLRLPQESGRIELEYKGSWGPLCFDLGLSQNETGEICRDQYHLLYQNFRKTYVYRDLGNNESWYDNATMECSSTKLHCEGEPPEEPQIESVGEIYAGNTTTFECTVVGGIPKPTIGWEKDGKDTTTNETWGRPKNKTVFIGYTTFTTSPDDNKASLTCVVNYKPDSFYRRNITLDVLFTPIITIQDNVEVDEADDVTLLCNVTSNPVSTVTWTGPKGCNTSAETTLTLNRIYRTAIGNYTCSAENAIGREQNTAMLYINAPPKMCLQQHGFTKVNQNLKLTCSATGIPTPIVTWFREAEELANTNSPDYIIEAGVSPDNPYLVSSTLTVSDTEGRNVFGYRCRVTNDNGVIQKTFRIRRKLKCRCLSRLIRNCVPLELKQEELDVVVFETKEILAIDKSRLTATVTRFVSANDDRQSSFVIGSVAVTILASLLVLLIGCDLIGHFVIDPQLKNKRK